MPIYILTFFMILSLSLLLVITYKVPYSPWRILSKTLCSILFITLAIIAFLQTSAPKGYSLPLLIGLFMSGIGDVLLGFSDQKPLKANKLFASGVIAFSLAHIAFSIAFSSLGHIPSVLYFIIPFATLFLFYLLTANHFFDFQGFRRLISFYSFVISCMLLIGIFSSYQLTMSYQYFILAGVILFVVSDIILCFYYFFYQKHKLITTFNLLCYYIAQLFLALSLIYF